ncbi:MAG: AAA family ATPase [Proteobacteria bacterium]|nr:AAA family ATPase [Pseudomonadota bacterium]MBU1687593.1 AAA family ATPase [Pseudomonadota bacterium]
MTLHQSLTGFYQSHLPDGVIEGSTLKATCPFCTGRDRKEPGKIVVSLNSQGYFAGYFRCLNRCVSGGFAPHFGRLLGLDPALIPGHDPDREPLVPMENWSLENINQEIYKYQASLTAEIVTSFADRGISRAILAEMKIGFNGRYIVYPYYRENSCCYAAHCLSPVRSGEQFWLGDQKYASGGLQIFNVKDIDHCEDGALFVVEGEANLLCLRELGFPGVAVPAAADLESVDVRRFELIKTIFLVVGNTLEADGAARAFAARLGFKVRLFQWAAHRKRGFDLSQLALEDVAGFKAAVFEMMGQAKAFSPFRPPAREYALFRENLQMQHSESYTALKTGLPRFDDALGGVHGINIIGGPPKSGKSCLGIQLATGIAARRMPVIYYDFENGRQKVYQRTLARLSRLAVERLVAAKFQGEEKQRYEAASISLQKILATFRVVNDRKLTPELMRRHIDFLRHETGRDDAVVVIDSLHKLPFKDFSERRTGIDAWLREMESIRDELRVAFLVLSELTRQEGGRYDGEPHMGLFKGSGDIEYTADNALIFLPDQQVAEANGGARSNSLWLVASREHSPGLIARYQLDYPFWGFVEE